MEGLTRTHHFMMILKESDLLRREIEQKLTPETAAEYNKISAVRNSAFVELLKANMPYQDVGKAIRITIDDDNFDISKNALKRFVGEDNFGILLDTEKQSFAGESSMQTIESGDFNFTNMSLKKDEKVEDSIARLEKESKEEMSETPSMEDIQNTVQKSVESAISGLMQSVLSELTDAKKEIAAAKQNVPAETSVTAEVPSKDDVEQPVTEKTVVEDEKVEAQPESVSGTASETIPESVPEPEVTVKTTSSTKETPVEMNAEAEKDNTTVKNEVANEEIPASGDSTMEIVKEMQPAAEVKAPAEHVVEVQEQTTPEIVAEKEAEEKEETAEYYEEEIILEAPADPAVPKISEAPEPSETPGTSGTKEASDEVNFVLYDNLSAEKETEITEPVQAMDATQEKQPIETEKPDENSFSVVEDENANEKPTLEEFSPDTTESSVTSAPVIQSEIKETTVTQSLTQVKASYEEESNIHEEDSSCIYEEKTEEEERENERAEVINAPHIDAEAETVSPAPAKASLNFDTEDVTHIKYEDMTINSHVIVYVADTTAARKTPLYPPAEIRIMPLTSAKAGTYPRCVVYANTQDIIKGSNGVARNVETVTVPDVDDMGIMRLIHGEYDLRLKGQYATDGSFNTDVSIPVYLIKGKDGLIKKEKDQNGWGHVVYRDNPITLHIFPLILGTEENNDYANFVYVLENKETNSFVAKIAKNTTPTFENAGVKYRIFCKWKDDTFITKVERED